MITTTSIHKLQTEHNLLQNTSKVFFNEDVIHAAAILAYKNGCKDAESLYNAIYDECDMSLAATLNGIDRQALFEYAEFHSSI